jgi:hypothetical protein
MAKERSQKSLHSARGTDGRTSPRGRGVSQLSLVEHALCPLDRRTSLRENLRHETQYQYTGPEGNTQTAKVTVYCPAGLSSADEFYLWGLLALTFAQAEPRIEFQATPHYCLRRLGFISPGSKGGKSYRLFRDALRRLSAVRYQNEAFYDPIRREHRVVSFGFLSYSLPLDPDSSRAWRIVWDPLFFEYCQATASQLSFDLELYRSLDHASRRLFLLLSKLFWRHPQSPLFDVRHLAVHVLGFSTGLASRTLNAKVKHCAQVLREHEVIAPAMDTSQSSLSRQGKGRFRTRFVRGAYFEHRRPPRKAPKTEDSPLYDPLRAVGFDGAAIGRVLARFPEGQIQLWADVTLAAMEHKGPSFFRRSPQAFFMDNIQHAAKEGRTPPDWFWELRRAEQHRHAERARRMLNHRRASKQQNGSQAAEPACRVLEVDRSPEELATDLMGCFLAAGQSERDARRNAERFVEKSVHSGKSGSTQSHQEDA